MVYIAKDEGRNAKCQACPHGLLTNRGAPHACAECKTEQDVSPDALVDRVHHRAVELGLAKGGNEAEGDAEGKELLTLKKVSETLHTCQVRTFPRPSIKGPTWASGQCSKR